MGVRNMGGGGPLLDNVQKEDAFFLDGFPKIKRKENKFRMQLVTKEKSRIYYNPR